MKKSLILITLIASLISGNAFAKTQGNYIGTSILNTSISSFDFYDKKHDGNDVGIGLDYKYAINFNNFFIAPGIFYNFNNVKLKYKDLDSDPYVEELKYSYGLKSDFGYDVNNDFAVFATFGFAELRNYHSFNFISSGGAPNSTGSSYSTNEALLFGGGAKYSISEQFDLIASYEYLNYIDGQVSEKRNPEIIRVGLAYHF